MRWLDWIRRRGSAPDDSLAAAQLQLQALSAAMATQHKAFVEASRASAREEQQSLEHTVTRLESFGLSELTAAVVAIHASARGQTDLGRRLEALQLTPRRRTDSARVLDRLSRMAEAGRPILVGPWTGDVGTELLYWVPFVRWFARRYSVAPAQMHVVSRGGAPFYDGLAERYTDIRAFRGFERQILRRVRSDHQQRHALLHPGLMCRLFAPYWDHDLPFQHIADHTIPKRLAPPAAPTGLPERFVAVRFAFSPVFPETDANRAWLDELLVALTRTGDVVWLGSDVDGIDGAGQTAYTPPPLARLHHVAALQGAAPNVALQAAVVSRADAYVGTYGGLSYLAHFYGVRAVAYAAGPTAFRQHRRAAQHMLNARSGESLIVLDIADAVLLSRLLEPASGSGAP